LSLEQAETALQLLGSAALVQVFVKKFLFADVRPLQLSQYVSFWYMLMLLLGCSVFIGVVIFSVSFHPSPLCIQQSHMRRVCPCFLGPSKFVMKFRGLWQSVWIALSG
jgi:hypothetical protein